MNTENFIDSIISGDTSASKNAFDSIMNAKIQDALSARKIELANAVYNGAIDQEEEIEDELQATETETDGSEGQDDQSV